jgi:predicted PurR-regulated permease PerM
MSAEQIDGAYAYRWSLPRGLIILLGIAAALITALGLREFAAVLGPVFLALVLSIVVHPVRRFADRHNFPAWVGIILSLLAVYGIVAGLFAILVISGIQFASLLQDYGPQFQAFLREASRLLESVGISPEKLQGMVDELSPSRLVGLAGQVLGGIAGVLSNILFLIVLLFFTVADAGSFASKLQRILPGGERLAAAFNQFAVGSRQYLVVATIFGVIVAVCDVVALYILDIRYAWLWGLLAFITNYIPNIGFIIGLLPPTIIALLDHDVVTAIIVVAVYCVLNFVIQTIIQPRVVGSTVGLSATLSFLSLIIWATILGAAGAFLAIPLSLFVKSLLVDVDPEHEWVGPLLSSGEKANGDKRPPPAAAEVAATPPEPIESTANPPAADSTSVKPDQNREPSAPPS